MSVGYVGEGLAGESMEVVVAGFDGWICEIHRLGHQGEAYLVNTHGASDSAQRLYVRKPKGRVVVDREKVLALGADPERLRRLLAARVEG